jgi:hypothetical protein
MSQTFFNFHDKPAGVAFAIKLLKDLPDFSNKAGLSAYRAIFGGWLFGGP